MSSAPGCFFTEQAPAAPGPLAAMSGENATGRAPWGFSFRVAPSAMAAVGNVVTGQRWTSTQLHQGLEGGQCGLLHSGVHYRTPPWTPLSETP